ncbi:hypothetical protein BK816_00585 [Boudabousia tangfeifanii]|uniref:Calcineurin-like phosphoesterase domain-containing protein n=1 Tax=Boudabousia tangfeifanii TaxID=1912795 RepID=A0A1D9MI49_9ACTO|nr:metallophosphoesterase [Boudabousia tangfeifanii]AOZ71972.1 hypothetical protein BK816_00585 [Boudabousia tangfeifanii]
MRTSKFLAGAALLAPIAGFAWGAFERRWPYLEQVTLTLPAEGEATVDARPPLKILQVADLHLRPKDQWLIDFVRDLERLEPDLVVATGDNFGALEALPSLQEALHPLLRFPGVFVLGSNDYFSPKPKSWTRYLRRDPRTADDPNEDHRPDLPTRELVDFFENAGWVNVENTQAEMLDGKVQVWGTADAHMENDSLDHLPYKSEATNTPATELPWLRLGVTHAPYLRVVEAFAQTNIDLLLAGHTHGGQLCVPGYGALVTNCDLPRPAASGLSHWQDLKLFVSAGLGTSRFAPFRFACRPRASLITINWV